MLKTVVTAFFVFFIGRYANAQTADQIFDQYLDMEMARTANQSAKALLIGESILPNVGKLPVKTQVMYYYSLAKVYDDSFQGDNAITYYDKVLAARPDYYVPHRALGYIYVNNANELAKKTQVAKGDAQLTADYKAMILKALPHLEKAEACDPSDETLTLIKKLYTAINDTQGLATLNSRLSALSKNCVTVLSE
jgi:hypothetical protein